VGVIYIRSHIKLSSVIFSKLIFTVNDIVSPLKHQLDVIMPYN